MLSGCMMIYFDYKNERVDRENFIKQMDDMVWRNTSKHIVNQAFIVSQLNNNNQLALFSCNKTAQTLFNIKPKNFGEFLNKAKLNIGKCVFNSRIFENLPFKKNLNNLREYLLAHHSKMKQENTSYNQLRSSGVKKSQTQIESPKNEVMQAMQVAAAQAANKRLMQNNSIYSGFQCNADPGGKFDGRIGGGGGIGELKFRGQSLRRNNYYLQIIINICKSAWRKMSCLKPKRPKTYSVDELTTNKGNDADMFPNNHPLSMENIGNYYNFLDETPSKSIDVDYLNCTIINKDLEREYKVSVFKYKGGPSGDKSPLLILCIEEINKNDFKNLKEIILEKGHFITNILEFFSVQLKDQIKFLNDHLKYNYSSHSLQYENQEINSQENIVQASGSGTYNIAESQDITSKSLVEINKQLKYGKKMDKSNISAQSKDYHNINLALHEDDNNNSPPNSSLQCKQTNKQNEEGNEQIYANNTFRAKEHVKQNFLAPPPVQIHQRQILRSYTPDPSPTKIQNIKGQHLDVQAKKRSTLDITSQINNNNLSANANIQKQQNQILTVKSNQTLSPYIAYHNQNANSTFQNSKNQTTTSTNQNVNFKQGVDHNIPNNTQNNNVKIINNITNNIQITNNIYHSVPNNQNKTYNLNVKAHSNTFSHNNQSNQNISSVQQISKLAPSIKGLPSTQDALANPTDYDIHSKINQNNINEKDLATQHEDISQFQDRQIESPQGPIIETKKIVSEQVIPLIDEDEINNTEEKEILSQDEILNDDDRKRYDQLIKYNKSLVEICHNAKLIALKSLIQVSNYSDCYRHKEARPLPLKISEFQISELILNTFYFNSKPILIYKSKHQVIKSDDRRLIQVIFNILNFLKKTDQIKFIVMDQEEYEMTKMNQSISKVASQNPDTAKFINYMTNQSKMYASQRGVENYTEYSHKRKENSGGNIQINNQNYNYSHGNNNNYYNNNNINNNQLHDFNNSDRSCNVELESTPNAQQPNHHSGRQSKVGYMKRLSEKKADDYNNEQNNAQNANIPAQPQSSSSSKISNMKEDNSQPLLIRSSAGGNYTVNNITADEKQDVSQIDKDTYNLITLGQIPSNNMSSIPKMHLNTNLNGDEDLIDITHHKTNINDVTPTNNLHQSNMQMITQNNTQANQESIPNISYSNQQNYQHRRKFYDPAILEEVVLDGELDDENYNNLSQKINLKKKNQKFNVVQIPQRPSINAQSSSLDDEIFSENYCEQNVNENVDDVVMKNLQYHQNEKKLREMSDKRSNSNTPRLEGNNNFSSQGQVVFQNQNSKYLNTINNNNNQNLKIEISSANQNYRQNNFFSNNKNYNNNPNNSNQQQNTNLRAIAANTAAQFSNVSQQNAQQQLPYLKQRSQNNQSLVKDITCLANMNQQISLSAKLDSQNHKVKDSQSLPPNKQKPITFFNVKNNRKEENINQTQFVDQEQIFTNLVSQKNQNQNYGPNESAYNLRRQSQSTVGMGKGFEIQSPPIIFSPSNYNNSINNIQNKVTSNLCESPTNDYHSSHAKINAKSYFSKSYQAYPTSQQLNLPSNKAQNIGGGTQYEDQESGVMYYQNQMPLDEEMIRSQNIQNHLSSKSVKLVENQQYKKKSSIKKIVKPYSRANSNNSSIVMRKTSNKSGDHNNTKMYASKRISTAGINSKAQNINQFVNEEAESVKQNLQEKNTSSRKNKRSGEDDRRSRSDVIAIEIQMEGDNMKFNPFSNESIQMIATNEIIKLLGPNKKIQISHNKISFYLYTNLESQELESNFVTNCEKYEEILDLRNLMNNKAVKTIRKIANTIDNKTCKTIYTLENKPHNFALVDEKQLESHQKHIQMYQTQHMMGNMNQNSTDFHSLHSLTKNIFQQNNQNTAVGSQQQLYQKNRSLKQESPFSNSGTTFQYSKTMQPLQLNLYRLQSDNSNTYETPTVGAYIVNNSKQQGGNSSNFSLDNKLQQHVNKQVKEIELMQSYSQRSNLPNQQLVQEKNFSPLKSEKQQTMNKSANQKLQLQKFTLDNENNFTIQNQKPLIKQTNTIRSQNSLSNAVNNTPSVQQNDQNQQQQGGKQQFVKNE
ncbi:hypothetical protein TTHERM_00305500 (macronuclear) [Tetrahymena thermophila SB210]|uniref:Uncharacterized protein n=1 Tax=Tetrahymena thermophila (strain SB210) TaxID=312017 RepID=I7MFY0_TETTS|nr:hypothetical protein TTHERM_00305500 [Tetrahymena thermophila SB210]EAS00782.2 hypothetical protein TTHERM_00305500 [Tetrahymena thermophila SB210]|eukprot:XP_001021027.2 hypothetical protein TTHERM_00305500 [Tetrahymena thermophila SB210]